MKHNVFKLSILLILIVSLLCSCSIFNKPDNGDNGSTGNMEAPDGGNTNVGDNNNNQPDTPNNPDDNTPENPDSGNEGGENGGNNNKPTEPNPDAGKNGIDEILLAFGEYKANDDELEDSTVGATLKSYTFNKQDVNASNPVALYVIGHGETRVGTDSDVSIIRDLLEEYIVVVLDYQGAEYAVSPYLDESLHDIKLDMMQKGTFLEGINYNSNQTYLIPAGCRIVRNVEFFNIMESAPKGVVNKILDVWNNQSQIKDKLGDAWVKADTLDDIVMKNGDSLTAVDENGNYKYLTYHLDLIYPANPESEVPVIMAASTGAIRNNSLSSTKADRIQYVGFLFGGYAVSSLDHDYFPFMKDEAGWGHIEPNYTLQTYMGTRFLTAAVRCTKYYADDYGYSTEKYGAYGFSKSSWVALFKQADLATTDPDDLEEVYTYGGYAKGECLGDQPFQTYRNGQPISSGITCVYHGMGNGTNECYYLDESNIPQMVGVGEKCEYNSWEKFFKTKNVLGNMDNSGCNWVPVIMYGVNHTWPKNVEDKLYGYNYYYAFKSFFAHHLKGEAAVLLHTSVKLDGFITEDEEIYLQFNAAVDASSALMLLDSNGNVVAGQWISARGGTQWKFIPEAPFTVGNSYRIVLDGTAADAYGNAMAVMQAEFTYAEGEKAPEVNFNSSISGSIVEDTYVAANSTAAQELDYSTSKDVLGTYSEYYRAYFKFDFSDILSSDDFEAFKNSGKIQFSFAIAKGADSLVNTTKFTFGGFAAGEGITDVPFSEVTWKNLKSDGSHSALNWGSATNLLSSESIAVSPDNISYYNGILTFTFDYSEIADMIDPDTGYAVFVFRTVGTGGISIAAMENKTHDAPSVSFVYNK